MKSNTPSLNVLQDWLEVAVSYDCIGYWADIRHADGQLEVRELEAGDKPGPWMKVSTDTMLKGWELVSSPGFKIDPSIVQWGMMDIKADEGYMSDVYSLDAILQAGLFGEIVYG